MLVADHLVLMDIWPYWIIFYDVYVVITISVIMLLRDLGLAIIDRKFTCD
jgi:hypothetical protein